jgi:hypothetical protein
MTIRKKYIPNHLLDFYYNIEKVYFKFKHLIENNNFEFIDDLYLNDKRSFKRIFNSIFFFYNPELNKFLLSSNYILTIDLNKTLYLCVLSNDKKLFTHFLNNYKIDFSQYKIIFQLINKNYNFEYSEILLHLDVPHSYKEEFFLDCCKNGKSKTIEHILNNLDYFKFDAYLINKGFKICCENARTGTIQKILKRESVIHDFDKNLIDFLSTTREYKIIKLIFNHKDFNRKKYTLYFFEKLFLNFYKNNYNNHNYRDFLHALLDKETKNHIPDSIYKNFILNKYNLVHDFFINRNKISNF